MNTHIKVISVFDIILGALTAAGGTALLVAVLTGAIALEQASAVTASTITGIAIFGSLFMIGVGILGIVVGVKLGEHKNWARITQIIFGALQLINFPLGTAFGVYSLWAMLSEKGHALFVEQRPPEKLRRAA